MGIMPDKEEFRMKNERFYVKENFSQCYIGQFRALKQSFE